MLKIQEGDIRKTLLMNADAYTLQQRNENERKVKTVLLPQNKLAEILSVHKGKVTLRRFERAVDNKHFSTRFWFSVEIFWLKINTRMRII